MLCRVALALVLDSRGRSRRLHRRLCPSRPCLCRRTGEPPRALLGSCSSIRRETNEIQHNRLKYNNIPPSLLPVCALFAPLLENSRLFRALCLHIVAAAASWFVASTRKHNAAPLVLHNIHDDEHTKGQTKTAPLSIKTKGRPFLCWLMFAVCMRDDGRQSLNHTRGRALCRTPSQRRTCP